MRHCSIIAFGPHYLSLVVATLVLLVTNAGVRRPGYEGRGMAVESKQQSIQSFISTSVLPPRLFTVIIIWLPW